MPKLKMAGLVMDICHDNPILNQQIGDYLTEEAPDFTVALDDDYITREIEEEIRCDLNFPKAYSEYLAIYRYIATKILDYDGFLMHGSAIGKDGRAYLFCAPSGTGKSTHTRLWREAFPDCIMVNDDKPIIRKSAGEFFACGTPWSGKHDLDTNISLPLKGIVILARGEVNRIERVRPEAVLGLLFNQIYRPSSNEAYLATIDLVSEMLGKVPVYKLWCNMEQEAAILAEKTLSQDSE
ncbi:MAG: hypothetical protein IJW46_06580 [Clostridia bacterium]|nr:hypothetical protein [Clostridia bacterium]